MRLVRPQRCQSLILCTRDVLLNASHDRSTQPGAATIRRLSHLFPRARSTRVSVLDEQMTCSDLIWCWLFVEVLSCARQIDELFVAHPGWRFPDTLIGRIIVEVRPLPRVGPSNFPLPATTSRRHGDQGGDSGSSGATVSCDSTNSVYPGCLPAMPWLACCVKLLLGSKMQSDIAETTTMTLYHAGSRCALTPLICYRQQLVREASYLCLPTALGRNH